MGVDNGTGWMNRLWKLKFIILLAVAVAILAFTTYYYNDQSSDRAAELSRMTSELDGMNVKYYNLSNEHQALIASHNDLSDRYSNLSDTYNSLSSNESSLRSDYDSLSANVARFQETSGSRIALYYRTYKGGTVEEPKIIVEATAYNVGNNKADRLTIKCRVIFDNQPSLNEQSFTNVAPLDKRSYTWEYQLFTQVESVWVE